MMTEVNELRVALTVEDFEQAVGYYRDALGLRQVADWSSDEGRVVLLEAGRATIEILDEAQAEFVDRIEAGQRISGHVRLAVGVAEIEPLARRLVTHGGEEVAAPVTTPWGDRNARIQTPDGIQMTLFNEM